MLRQILLKLPRQHGPEQELAGRLLHSSSSALNAPLPVDSVDLTVDGKAVSVPKGASILQACEAAGVDVPRFCYHQKLSVAGNCRMCLVEVAKAPKPVASCAMPAGPGMIVKTDTELVHKAREGVMEFMLINHPLDCPICDQGGECDLQDQSMLFGSSRGRFIEAKRSVSDKNLGPLVKTVMTRCIHCTRCVRYGKEIAGVEDIGMTGRGNASEIGTYVSKLMKSELSGNVIDLCPVGALTSKPYAFTARPWELKSTESVDVSDALGCSIRVDSRGAEVMRIVPRQNDAVNEDWISDKARFQYDGLKRQRLAVPMVKGAGGGLEPASWLQALQAVRRGVEGVEGRHMKAIAGKLADAESMMALKDLMNKLGCSDTRHETMPADMDADARSSYLANSSVLGLEEADLVLLIGTNPRVESPVYNARIRKMFLNGTKIALIGESADLTYNYQHLGAAAKDIKKVAGSPFVQQMKDAKRPMIIVGPGVLNRSDAKAVMKDILDLASAGGVVRDGWNGFNLLHECASAVAALDLGFVPSAPSAAPKFVYLLGADDYADADVPADAFVVYQGHHGDKGAARADVVLPGAAFTEKAGTYVNFEGRVQRTKAVISTPGDARDDWKIICAVSEIVGARLPYTSEDGIAERLMDVSPTFQPRFQGKVQKALWLNGEYRKTLKGSVNGEALKSPIASFFMTDAISRASQTMARCVQAHAAAAAAGPSL